MNRARTWALAGTASFAGVLVVAVVSTHAGPAGGPLCRAHQATDIATMERVVKPLLPPSDRGLVIATTGCASGDPASISWDSTRPAGETLAGLAHAGWARLPNPQAMDVDDGYSTTDGTEHITVTYLAENTAFYASTD